MPTLRETGLSKSPLGQSMIIAATLADFLTLLGITFYVMWHEFGIGWRFLGPIPLFLGFGFLLKIGRLWAWWHPNRTSRLLAAENSQEMGVRLSLALLFLFVALSELVHIEPVLGAFMGGAMLSIIFRDKIHLETKLSGIGFGFLIPLFFIDVGMNFNLTNVVSPSQLLFTLKLLVLAILVKLLPSLLFILNRVPFRKAFNMGILLSSRLSLIIVAASLGLEFGFITATYKDAIVLLAVLTCLLGPTLFRLLNRSDNQSKPDTSQEKKPPKRIPAGWMRKK
jgi:Kef-type K+ transport system membrane component KefB